MMCAESFSREVDTGVVEFADATPVCRPTTAAVLTQARSSAGAINNGRRLTSLACHGLF